jgi:hypothetical protein
MKPEVKISMNDARRIATWKQVALADNAAIEMYDPLISMVCASIQIIGTGTVSLKGSNDGVNFQDVKDLEGNDIVVSDMNIVEFSSGMAFYKPSITAGGPVDIIISHWKE